MSRSRASINPWMLASMDVNQAAIAVARAELRFHLHRAAIARAKLRRIQARRRRENLRVLGRRMTGYGRRAAQHWLWADAMRTARMEHLAAYGETLE